MNTANQPEPAEKRDLLKAFDQVVDREKAKARPAAPARPRRSGIAIVLLAVLGWGGLGYIWVGKPAGLFPVDPALSRPPAEQEATLRFGMYLERERVHDYFDKHRRLPASLGDAGPVETGVEYAITGDSAFVLTGTMAGLTLQLSSSDAVQAFLEPTGMRPPPRGQ